MTLLLMTRPQLKHLGGANRMEGVDEENIDTPGVVSECGALNQLHPPSCFFISVLQ
jgi:hypothetical protein